MGIFDRIIRFVLGIVAVVLGLLHSYWWFILAAIFIITAVVGFCPAYTLFGIKTTSVVKAKKSVAKKSKRK